MQVKSQKLRKQLKLTTKASILISWLRGLLEKPKRAEHKMRLIVGLGNPGEVYQYNRHNIGFMVIDSLVDKYDLSPAKSQFNGLVYTGRINDNKVILLKPSTFMNLAPKTCCDCNLGNVLAKGNIGVKYHFLFVCTCACMFTCAFLSVSAMLCHDVRNEYQPRWYRQCP